MGATGTGHGPGSAATRFRTGHPGRKGAKRGHTGLPIGTTSRVVVLRAMRHVLTKPEDKDTLPVHAAVRALLGDDPAGFFDRLAGLEQECRQAVAETRGPDRPTPPPEPEAAKDERTENVEALIEKLLDEWDGKEKAGG